MKQDRNIIRLPGPTPIPPSVQRVMMQPIIGHRGIEKTALIQSIKHKIKPVFGTDQNVLLLTSSGTSGLEAAVVNTASSGDEVLVIVTGVFGDRFAKICLEYELIVHRIDVEWGSSIEPELVKDVLVKNPQIKVVFSTFCETSTGVLNPVATISNIIHDFSEALFVVDGVSCVGGVETKMDEWKVDIFVTASHKAMMLPPGLCFLAISNRAWNIIKENKQPRFYLDLRKYKESLEFDSMPFTPGVSILFGLDQVLTLFQEESLNETYKRHQLMKNMLRAAVKALNMPLLTSDLDASPTVTAIRTNDFDSRALIKIVKGEFNMDIADGLQSLKGNIIRIGHMGYCFPMDILQTVGILELSLQRIGKKTPLGQGILAAEEIYMKSY